MIEANRIGRGLAVAALSIGLSACGSSSSSSTSSTPASRAAFKAHFVTADADVKRVGQGIARSLQQAQQGRVTDVRLAARFDALRGRLSSDLAALALVPVPGDLQGDRDAYENVLKPLADDLGAGADGLRAGDQAKGGAAGRNLVLHGSKVKPVANALRSKLGLATTP